jgi:Protein of unknown function (DUF3276).
MYSEDYERARAQERKHGRRLFEAGPCRKAYLLFRCQGHKGNNDFYLTITESKRRQEHDGTFSYDKHKIFLYKEDFEKFAEGLEDAVAFIRARLGQVESRGNDAEGAPGKSFTDVNFDEF